MAVKFTKPKAIGVLCWGCDRKLHAGGRSYVLAVVDGVQRPFHGQCAPREIDNKCEFGPRVGRRNAGKETP